MAMTTTASLSTVTDAYDLVAYFALRDEMFYDAAADVKPTKQSHRGDVVTFTIYDDLAVASAPLDESTDVDSVALSDTQPTVTLDEYGNAVTTTAQVRAFSYLGVDQDAANAIGYNAGESLDTIARDVLYGGSNARYTGTATARNTVKPTDTLTATAVRRARADLVGASVKRWSNGFYRAFVHPDAAVDLRTETGAAAWREPHTYSQPGEIWNGEIGTFEGFAFVEHPRAPILADAGSSTTLTDVYQSLFMGRQGLAKAYSSSESAALPKVIIGPTVDKLKRFNHVGWHWIGGYGRFREAALRRVEHASSIGAN